MDWIEPVDKQTFEKEAAARQKKGIVTEPRTRTVWVELPYTLGFCEVPSHDEVIKTLDATAREYRDKYPTRWVIDINGVMVCRDCFLVGADKDGDDDD